MAELNVSNAISHDDDGGRPAGIARTGSGHLSWQSKIPQQRKSAPISIPATGYQRNRHVQAVDCQEEEEGCGFSRREEEMVPPHVLVSRRMEQKMAFSMCAGTGRTLKGRDLKHVRNYVLRMTGFIEQ